jgi:hypothetical protein
VGARTNGVGRLSFVVGPRSSRLDNLLMAEAELRSAAGIRRQS